MFLNLFILAIKVIVDKNNYKSVIEKSYKIPVFILIYSPHCPHCRSIHPTWEDLMKKYESDKKVMIVDCNDIDYRKECDSIYKTDSFPTFVILTRGKAKRIRPERNINSFINETERLKMIDYTTSCSSFQAEFNDQYPAFILSDNKSNVDKCNELKKIMKAFPDSSRYLYFNETMSEEEKFVGMMSSKSIGKFEGPKNMDSLILFMKEYMMTPFGSWNYSDATLLNKRIGFFIHSSHSEFMTFSNKIEEYSTNFSLCKMDVVKFSKLVVNVLLPRSQIPAFAVSNKEKTKFYIIKNVLKDPDANETIRKAAAGEFDDIADIDLSVIFPIHKKQNKRAKIVEITEKKKNNKDLGDESKQNVENKNQNFGKPTRTSFPSKLASKSFKVFLVLFFIVAAASITGILYYINNAGSKME